MFLCFSLESRFWMMSTCTACSSDLKLKLDRSRLSVVLDTTTQASKFAVNQVDIPMTTNFKPNLVSGDLKINLVIFPWPGQQNMFMDMISKYVS
ncbi:unnamed protein product [Caenorhabditis angaria]|uniref:Uncharacterized protein n=1 Tax=Caenorhabditis angaria TaxID=860376 RepID=A0A9P1IWY2_9PELO|nr:unnamed protein product [Caenorhabditis angaria]